MSFSFAFMVIIIYAIGLLLINVAGNSVKVDAMNREVKCLPMHAGI